MGHVFASIFHTLATCKSENAGRYISDSGSCGHADFGEDSHWQNDHAGGRVLSILSGCQGCARERGSFIEGSTPRVHIKPSTRTRLSYTTIYVVHYCILAPGVPAAGVKVVAVVAIAVGVAIGVVVAVVLGVSSLLLLLAELQERRALRRARATGSRVLAAPCSCKSSVCGNCAGPC